jgi:hypothetical protein
MNGSLANTASISALASAKRRGLLEELGTAAVHLGVSQSGMAGGEMPGRTSSYAQPHIDRASIRRTIERRFNQSLNA